MKCTTVVRAQDRTLWIVSNIGKQEFCACVPAAQVLLTISQRTIVDGERTSSSHDWILQLAFLFQSRYKMIRCVKCRFASTANIDRECAECLHARIAAFKTGEVGKAPGTAIQPSPAFSAKDGSASGGVR